MYSNVLKQLYKIVLLNSVRGHVVRLDLFELAKYFIAVMVKVRLSLTNAI